MFICSYTPCFDTLAHAVVYSTLLYRPIITTNERLGIRRRKQPPKNYNTLMHIICIQGGVISLCLSSLSVCLCLSLASIHLGLSPVAYQDEADTTAFGRTNDSSMLFILSRFNRVHLTSLHFTPLHFTYHQLPSVACVCCSYNSTSIPSSNNTLALLSPALFSPNR